MSRPKIPATVQPPFPIVIRNTTVVAGFGRGSSEMGIPTANVPVDQEPELNSLDTGVYFGYVRLIKPSTVRETHKVARHDGKSEVDFTYGEFLRPVDLQVLPMVMSLGWNPFFKNSKKACELHILHEFKSDFYGCKLNFNILGYVRPELDYVSMEALIKDIQLDIATAKEYLETEDKRVDGHGEHFAEPERVEHVQHEVCAEDDERGRHDKTRVVARVVQVPCQAVDLVPAPADSGKEEGPDQHHVVDELDPRRHELREVDGEPPDVQKRRRHLKQQEDRTVVMDHLSADSRQEHRAGHHAVHQEPDPEVFQIPQRHERVPDKVVHVGSFQKLVQILLQGGQVRLDADLVLPFELVPHLSELGLRTRSRLDVVHDVHVQVRQNHNRVLVSVLSVVNDVSKDHTGVRRRDLDGGLYTVEPVWTNVLGRWLVHHLQVAQRGKLQTQVAQRAGGLVNKQNVQRHVELVHLNVCLSINRVREPGQLLDLLQSRRKVLLDDRVARSKSQVLLVNVLDLVLGAQLSEHNSVVNLFRIVLQIGQLLVLLLLGLQCKLLLVSLLSVVQERLVNQ
ncbi:hypothetical protein OGAPHI_004563 [Ogataea philodendri]|uniref:Riboflavin kinase n=1 Tax=Ogataea philodendri TaxID=1378263 RepID=A0A9P8P3K8_9ASCO|nr:uncharacterized protein OGAPHI_004563 [Ogataea philodendri]KAH3664212.1 hypothetical protein OGAPHI_004563 [Ogataea philodendri]